MAIESKNLVVAAKVYSRGIAAPLDASEIYSTLGEAQTYAKSPTAYAGQTIKVLEDGKYNTYVLDGDAGDYTLSKVGVDASAVKNYVQVVTELPSSSQEQGVIYINTTDNKGYIYNGEEFKVIFEEVEGGLNEKLEAIETSLEGYAKLEGATFTGAVTLAADPNSDLEAATKQYVDRLVAGINDFTVGVVDSDTPLPTEDYKVGQTFRVAEAGIFAETECEAGDLILVIKDFDTEYKATDFLVIQANIDGAVTGPDASTDANIVVFDGTTGRKVKDSAVTLASLSDAIGKAHEHANLDKLNTYDVTKDELLGSVDTKIETAKEEIRTGVNNALGDYYTKSEVDSKLTPVTESLNAKADITVVDSKIAAKVGEIGDKTVKQYVDDAVGSGGVDVAEQIEEAKQAAITESKNFTNQSLTVVEF